MKALRSHDKSVRDRTMLIAEAYRELASISDRAMKFSDLRDELKQHTLQFRKLAKRVTRILGPLELALPLLLTAEGRVNQQSVNDTLLDRLELTKRLEALAEDTDRLTALSTWPKGGRWNVAKAYYRSPKRWLADQCVKMFFNFGNRDDIQPTSPQRPSRFGQYAEAVYELATGKYPSGVSLEKSVNDVARVYQKNEYLNRNPAPKIRRYGR